MVSMNVNPFEQLPVQVADALTPHVRGIETAYEGAFLRVEHVELELPNGHTAIHSVVRHPGAVAMVVLDDETNILLEYQHRSAIDQITVEIPAGKLDAGEQVLAAARRELSEETGYAAEVFEYLTTMDVALGYSDERIHLYIAQGLTEGAAHTDEDELVTCFWMPLKQAFACVMAGTITDSKTALGIMMAAYRLGY